MKLLPTSIAVLVAALLSAVLVRAAPPVGPFGLPLAAVVSTGFTYQGQLAGPAGALSATCQFEFRLFDAVSGGSQVGPTLNQSVMVSSGLFTTVLDFGSGPFTGEGRWLQIGVQCPGDASLVALSPRQALSATPYALYALAAGSATSALSASTALTATSATTALTANTALTATTAITATSALTASQTPYGGLTGLPANLAMLANGTGCSAGQIPIWFVNAWACSSDQNTTYSAGLAITVTPGNVISVTGAPRPAAITTTLDAGPVMDLVLTIGIDGLPILAYYDITGGDLKVAHCETIDCSRATITTYVIAGAGGYDLAIVLGLDGLPLIAYREAYAMRVAHCRNIACTAATISTPSSLLDVGYWSSFAVVRDSATGGPAIMLAHSQQIPEQLRIGSCANLDCSAFTVPDGSAVDGTGGVGRYVAATTHPASSRGQFFSLRAVGTNSNGDVRIWRCLTTACGTIGQGVAGDVTTSADDVGYYLAVATMANGNSLVVYRNSTLAQLEAVACEDETCLGDSVKVLASSGQNPAVTILPNGHPLIVYADFATDEIRGYLCTDVKCTTGITLTGLARIAAAAADPNATSVAVTVGVDGYPLIAYIDSSDKKLVVVHTRSVFGTVGIPRR
ncbi:MAG: hypothetical protein U0556_08320 [Dehalococcoidia bacterium]